VPIEYVCLGRTLGGKGELRNVSVSGMFVDDLHHDLDPGDVVRMRLQLLSEATAVILRGEVVRTTRCGFAVRFHPLDARKEAKLRAALPVAAERERARRGC
jgi:hypothetical protein